MASGQPEDNDFYAAHRYTIGEPGQTMIIVLNGTIPYLPSAEGQRARWFYKWPALVDLMPLN
ncbi:MAG: hypothetical protein J0I18_19620 [Actinobacteria bacterium]|nr:hypothetical protein [Actinomycetota bacterium]